MSSNQLIFYLIILLSYSLSANTEDNYPTQLEKKITVPGVCYYIFDHDIVTIKNNWLDKTTTISIFDKDLEKKSLILNNTEIRDFYSIDSNIIAIATSKRRAFLTKFNPDFTVKKIYLLDTNFNISDNYKIHRYLDNGYIISKNNEIYYFDTKNKIKQIISNKYIENTFLSIDSLRFFYIRQSDNMSYLVENINHLYEKELLRIEPSNEYSISMVNNKLVVECHYESNSHIFFYSSELKLLNEFWIDVKKENYLIASIAKGEIGIYVISYDEDKYLLKRIDISSNTINQFEFPNYIISPLALQFTNNSITAIFQNAIYNFSIDLNVNFYKPVSIPTVDLLRKIKVIDNKDHFLLSTDITNIYQKKDNPFWQIYYYYDKSINYIVPIIFLTIISIIFYLYKKKKELNSTLLELSENDFIFVFNKKGDLININKRAMKIIEIDSSVPLGRFFKYYCISEHTKELYEIFEKLKSLKENFQQKIHIFNNNELHEYICNAVIKRRATGSIVGYLLSGTDITEELRQQKLNNFAQLAHDMQTNLSTLKLNAEELDVADEYSLNKKQKIIKQINILNQKVRDIVTVGRSSSVHKSKQNAKNIISDVIEEFDFEYYPNITFIDESTDFELNVDKQKLSRAIRNATENSLKSMKDVEDGRLTLRTFKNTKYAYFEVEDNGKGMNKDVKENMLTPFYTSAGGSGLGTMIMKNAIEQHGGEIIIESEVSKGTKIIFKIPIG